MKSMKKLMALMLVTIMMLAMATTAFAAEPTGKITITNASIGQKYELYKLLDATYNTETETTAYSTKSTSVKTAFAAAESEGDPIFDVAETADSDGNYSIAVAAGMSDAALTWVKANAASIGTKIDEKTLTAGNTIEWDVPYGYYFVTSGLGSVLTIDNNTPSVEIIDKNTTEPDTPDDPGDDPTNTGAKSVDKANASVGDTVSFTVKFTATNFVTTTADDGTVTTKQITKYVITDTPTGLKLNSDIKVVVGTTTILENASFSNDGKLELAWVDNSGNSIYKSPIDVTVTYTGVLTAAAAAEGKATNKAVISYLTKGSNTPEDINDDDPVVIDTYSFTLSKTDGTKDLSGAEFHLYDAQTGGNEIALVKESNTAYHVADATEKVATGFSPAVIVAGEVEIKGLAAGDYYLEETKAPLGYNPLTERQKVTVADGTNEIEVINQTGIELPSTGGAGTTMLIVLGSVLFMATAIVLVTKKRMYNQG